MKTNSVSISLAIMLIMSAFSLPAALDTNRLTQITCLGGSWNATEVAVKVTARRNDLPVSGKEDQAGGVRWHCKDADNYYLARANALEDNVTINHTIAGRRELFKNVDTKVASRVWYTLRVEFAGNKFTVAFDGRQVIEATDDSFKDAGKVGVWTKADSVTLFDDFSYGSK